MKSYQDLDVYKLSFNMAIEVHTFSLSLPNFELFEQGSQIRRSSKSIVSNIVEGFGRKKYKAEFIRFLIFAHASCDETISHLLMFEKIYTDKTQISELISSYSSLSKMLYRFIQYVNSNWKT